MRKIIKFRTLFIIIFFLSLIFAGCGGGGGSEIQNTNNSDRTDTTDNDTNTSQTTDNGTQVIANPLYLNSIIMGTNFPNVLKGMMVAIDDARGYAYVAGIMTSNIAVVNMALGSFVRSFQASSGPLNVVKLAFDNDHRKLWMVSSEGNYIRIVDPDNETVLAEKNIAYDKGSDADNYPVKNITLDPSRELIYLARTDKETRVSVFDSNLDKTGDILVGRTPWAIQWSQADDALVVLTTPHQGRGEIIILPQADESRSISYEFPHEPGENAPTHLTLDNNGDIYLASSSLWKVDKNSGTILWKTPLSLSVSEIGVSGNEIGVLHRSGQAGNNDDYISRLAVYNTADGRAISTRYADFESAHMAPVSNGGFVVGFAGSGHIGIYPPGSGDYQSVQVGTSVEDVQYIQGGKKLLMLNRLGGSQLVSYDLETGESRILGSDSIGAWPMRMALFPENDELFILSHFESKLSVLKISDLVKTDEINLYQNHSLTDTVSDMASSKDGSLLACLLCEQGVVVVVDSKTKNILATIQLGPVMEGAGPGRMNAAVDGENRRIFVYFDDDKNLYRLEEKNNFQTDINAVAHIEPSAEARREYKFKAVYYSPFLKKLMAWDKVINPDTLEVENTLEEVQRVNDENNGYLYAERHESNGDITMLTLNGETMEIIDRRLIGNYTMMGAYTGFDFDNGKFAQAMSADSLVYFYDLY